LPELKAVADPVVAVGPEGEPFQVPLLHGGLLVEVTYRYVVVGSFTAARYGQVVVLDRRVPVQRGFLPLLAEVGAQYVARVAGIEVGVQREVSLLAGLEIKLLVAGGNCFRVKSTYCWVVFQSNSLGKFWMP
jgi:hypothetical protein